MESVRKSRVGTANKHNDRETSAMARLGLSSRIMISFMRAGMNARYGRDGARMAASRNPLCERDERWIETDRGETRAILTRPLGWKEPLPVFINLHGGGFVAGKADVDDLVCQKISQEVGCLVVNVDYKLAPEYPFPQAIEEIYSLAKLIHDRPQDFGADPERVAIGGHSAGGNFAAAVCILAKRRGGPSFVLQILDYPPLDIATDPFAKTNVPDMKKVIPPGMAKTFNAAYLEKPENARDPLVSPVFASLDELRGLPAALIATAECDSLRDEGEKYAKMLGEAGVEVLYRNFAGCKHGFSHTVPAPQEAVDELWSTIYAKLKEAFRNS
ncbi:MAG: alpha/beta hydrolase [Spirochaetaceae bacterium]|nr:alpha/beta hydrolase [Spirochaetaceae bacterium]